MQQTVLEVENQDIEKQIAHVLILADDNAVITGNRARTAFGIWGHNAMYYYLPGKKYFKTAWIDALRDAIPETSLVVPDGNDIEEKTSTKLEMFRFSKIVAQGIVFSHTGHQEQIEVILERYYEQLQHIDARCECHQEWGRKRAILSKIAIMLIKLGWGNVIDR